MWWVDASTVTIYVHPEMVLTLPRRDEANLKRKKPMISTRYQLAMKSWHKYSNEWSRYWITKMNFGSKSIVYELYLGY